MRVLAINCGSSTLKFELLDAADEEHSLVRGIVDRIGGRGSVELSDENGERTMQLAAVADHGEAALLAIRSLDSSGLLEGIEAVGHRIVHGGARFAGPALLDGEALEEIERNLEGVAIQGTVSWWGEVSLLVFDPAPGDPGVADPSADKHARLLRTANVSWMSERR